MANYVFQGVARMLKFVTALTIHQIKCVAKADCLLVFDPSLKVWG